MIPLSPEIEIYDVNRPIEATVDDLAEAMRLDVLPDSPVDYSEECEWITDSFGNFYKIESRYQKAFDVIGSHHNVFGDTNFASPISQSKQMEMEMVCAIRTELNNNDLKTIKESHLQDMLRQIHDFERNDMNVGWLKEKLTTILRAKRSLIELFKLNRSLDDEISEVENKKRHLNKLRKEVCDLEGELEARQAKIAEKELLIAKKREEAQEAKDKLGDFTNGLI